MRNFNIGDSVIVHVNENEQPKIFKGTISENNVGQYRNVTPDMCVVEVENDTTFDYYSGKFIAAPTQFVKHIYPNVHKFDIGDMVIVRGNAAITKEYVSYIGYVEELPDSFENLNTMYRIKTIEAVGFMTEPNGVIFANKDDMILVEPVSEESITTNKDETALVEFTPTKSSTTNNDFLI